MSERLAAIAAILLFVSAVSAQPIEKVSESGPVKVTVTLDPRKPLIGDAVTLQITVIAEKDVELLMPEFGEALDRFVILDFVPRESIDDQERTVAKQKYRLQPPASGQHSVPPILIEYVDLREGQREAPEGFDAYEILTQRIDFEVESVLPNNATVDLKPPRGMLEKRMTPTTSRWWWLLVPVVLLGCASPWILQAIAEARRKARRRSAYEVARWRLDQLLTQARISAHEIEVFYVDLSNVVRRYLEDRFELRAPELTTEEFLTSLQESPDLTQEHQVLLRDFLRQADLVKFAGALPHEDEIQRSIEKAAQFLEETRENAPLMEMDEQGRSLEASETEDAAEATIG